MSQKVIVAGTGKSGIAAARLLLDMGGEVVLYDSNPSLDKKEIRGKFQEKMCIRDRGMVYAGKDQVLLYDQTESEYIRQNEDIPNYN